MTEATLRFRDHAGELFPEWKPVQLRDICKYSNEHGSGSNFIGTENMYQNFAGADVDESRTGKGIVYHAGDTLMSNIRPYLKKTWFADRNGVCSTDVLVFRPNGVSPEFLYQMISSDKFVQYVMGGVKGSKMPRGDKNHILDYGFMKPSSEEQERIVPLLSAVDALISEQESLIEDLEARKKGLMQKIFSQDLRFKADDGNEFPEWEPMPLSDIFETRNGYTPSKDNDAFWENGTLPWFRMEDIRENGGILSDAIQHITPQAVKKGGLFPANTVIFATSATIGEHALLTVPSLSNQRFTAIIPKDEYKERLLPKFIYYIGFDIDKYGVKHHAISTMPSVNMDDFKAYPFPMVDVQEQKKIVDLLSLIDDHLANEHAILKSWQALKTGLLQQMFV